MLSDLLTPDTIAFADDVTDWRVAVALAAKPLVENGAITPDYVQAITDTIAGPGGTYMDLGFGVTLAHSRPENGVARTGLSFLRVRPAVLLADDPDHPVDLFLCLAATDPSGHIQAMQELATLLTDEDRRTGLLAATSPADVTSVINEIGQNA